MGELADTGAVAFSDDGVPVASAGLMRRALQYASTTDRPLALHCEEPTLSHGGHVHEGRVAAELGFAGYPSVAESVAVERDLRSPATNAVASTSSTSRRWNRSRHCAAQKEAGVAASGEATPHHLVLTDDAVRSLDPNVKMNPPLRAEQDRTGAARGSAGRDDRGDRHRSRAARRVREGSAVRGGAVRGHRPRDGVRRALHASRQARAAAARDAARADVGRACADLRARPAARRHGRASEPRPARPRARVDGRRAAVPVAVGELLAARLDAQRHGANDARRRGVVHE